MPPGRRAGIGDTREAIADAARAEFDERGYTAATIRAVARRAGVDPALVYHYFGDKPNLYVASLKLPLDPRIIRDAVHAAGASAAASAHDAAAASAAPQRSTTDVAVARTVDAQISSAGVELVERFLRQFEDTEGAPGHAFVTLAQAVSSSTEVARSLREFLSARVWTDEGSDPDRAWSRVMVSAELVGLAWNRYLLRVEPVAAAPISEVAARIGPMIDALLRSAGAPGA